MLLLADHFLYIPHILCRHLFLGHLDDNAVRLVQPDLAIGKTKVSSFYAELACSVVPHTDIIRWRGSYEQIVLSANIPMNPVSLTLLRRGT